MVKAKSAYVGDLLLCSRHGALGEVDVYATHRSASTTAFCTILSGPFGGRTTEVVRLTRPAQPPVYFVNSGSPVTAIKVFGQHLLSLSKKNFRLAVVPKPVGQKGCTFHHGFSVAIYSPSKNATASICHRFGKLFESNK